MEIFVGISLVAGQAMRRTLLALRGVRLPRKSYYDFTAKLFNWRKGKAVIHYGRTKHYLPQDEVYVYFRYNDHESVMVALNNSEKEQMLTLPRFAESLSKYTQGKDIITGETHPLGKTLTIAPKTAMVLELQ